MVRSDELIDARSCSYRLSARLGVACRGMEGGLSAVIEEHAGACRAWIVCGEGRSESEREAELNCSPTLRGQPFSLLSAVYNAATDRHSARQLEVARHVWLVYCSHR